MLVETTDSLITGLVQGHFPVHLIEEFVVDHQEDWAETELESLLSLGVSEALVERITTLITLKDWSENGEVADFNGLALLLHHVAKALGQATPDHVEELQGLSL